MSHHPEPRSVLENVRRGGQELPFPPELSKTNCNLTDSYLIQAPPLLSTYWLKFRNSWRDWLMKTASLSCLLKVFKTIKLCYLKKENNNKEPWKDTARKYIIYVYLICCSEFLARNPKDSVFSAFKYVEDSWIGWGCNYLKCRISGWWVWSMGLRHWFWAS